MKKQRKSKRFPTKKLLKKGTFLLTVAGLLALHTGCGQAPQQEQYQTVEETTFSKGVVTIIEEVAEGDFKIVEERIVEKKEDSKVIVHLLDGRVEVQTPEEAQQKADNNTYHGGMGFGNVLMYGLMGHYLGRSLSSPMRRDVYKTPQAYEKAKTQSKPSLKKTAQTKTVRKPINARKGFGKRATGTTRRSNSG